MLRITLCDETTSVCIVLAYFVAVGERSNPTNVQLPSLREDIKYLQYFHTARIVYLFIESARIESDDDLASTYFNLFIKFLQV